MYNSGFYITVIIPAAPWRCYIGCRLYWIFNMLEVESASIKTFLIKFPVLAWFPSLHAQLFIPRQRKLAQPSPPAFQHSRILHLNLKMSSFPINVYYNPFYVIQSPHTKVNILTYTLPLRYTQSVYT